jgi:hypothetical protein
MKAFLLSLAGLAGLALATAPALAHGPGREYRRDHDAFRHRAAHRYEKRSHKYDRDDCYPPSRYCPPYDRR